jgi:hypothetical protein
MATGTGITAPDWGATRFAMTGTGPAGEGVKSVRVNAALPPGFPPVDWGTTRYSAESTEEAFAGKVAHPASADGSNDAYPPTVSVTCDA